MGFKSTARKDPCQPAAAEAHQPVFLILHTQTHNTGMDAYTHAHTWVHTLLKCFLADNAPHKNHTLTESPVPDVRNLLLRVDRVIQVTAKQYT